jgi:serpin B
LEEEEMKPIFCAAIAAVVLSSVVGGAVLISNGSHPGKDIASISDSPARASEDYKPNAAVDPKIIQADNKFAFLLFSELRKKDGSKNVFISAPSVALALSMTYNGASGETRKAMGKALQISGMSLDEVNEANSALLTNLNRTDLGVELTVANSLWASKKVSFSQSFIDRNAEYYKSEVAKLDFADPESVDRINGWVNSQTKGKIKTIINDLNPMDIMVLVNTVYFNGAWPVPFKRSETQEQDFTLTDRSQVVVPMMYKEGMYDYQQTKDFQAVMLNYAGMQMSMLIFLPSKDCGIDGFLKKLNAGNWKTWTEGFDLADGAIKLPRFKSEYDVELADQLKALGMGIAFESGQADFGGMCPPPAWLGAVIHKTSVTVNEEGSEAAAATAVVACGSAMPEPAGKFEMTVDRPFFCAIRDNRTGLILFMGAIMDPR